MLTALEVRGLQKQFIAGAGTCTARALVLRGIDFVARSGEVVAIIGPAGAGKSVFLLCAAGLLRPDAGEIRWFGDSSRSTAQHRVRHHVTCVVEPSLATIAELPSIHLLDSLAAASDEGVVSQWITQRRELGDAVIVALRDRDLALRLAPRVFELRAGILSPVAHPRARVAEDSSFRLMV